jgi:hypothetical protein
MNDIVTTDLSEYGYTELYEAGELLKAYAKNGCQFLNDGITLNLNKDSGKVFLSDEDFNVGVLEDDKLVQFYSCYECGNEGTQEEGEENKWDFEKHHGYCSKDCWEKANQ